jgi:hypothetical protein
MMYPGQARDPSCICFCPYTLLTSASSGLLKALSSVIDECVPCEHRVLADHLLSIDI